MKEIMEQYGQTILAVIVSLTVIGVFYGIWTHQLRDAVISYVDATTSGSGSLGTAIEESGGTCFLGLNDTVMENGLTTENIYCVDELFSVKDSYGNICSTTGPVQLLRVYDLAGRDLTEVKSACDGAAFYFYSEEEGAYRVRVRCNESASGRILDSWFYLTVNKDAEEESEEEQIEEEAA